MFHIPMSSPQRIRMFGFFVAIVALALQICVETPRVNGVGCEGRGSPRRGASGRPVNAGGETIADSFETSSESDDSARGLREERQLDHKIRSASDDGR